MGNEGRTKGRPTKRDQRVVCFSSLMVVAHGSVSYRPLGASDQLLLKSTAVAFGV